MTANGFRHLTIGVLLLGATLFAQAPTLARIYIEPATGDIHLVDSTGRDSAIRRSSEAVRDPKVAVDKMTAGWLLEDRAGTTYTVPQALVLYRSGRIARTITPSSWPIIMAWQFFADGKQVCFSSTALHGAESERRSYELHDVRTGKIIERWDDRLSRTIPRWAEELDSLEQKRQR